MAFRPEKKQPQFADLKGILAQTKKTENSLYQTVELIIERLTQFQSVTLEKVQDISDSGDAADTLLALIQDATFITVDDETTVLPNSVQIIAGPGITIDTSVPGELTISSTGAAGAYYDAPLTDGNVDETDLIFASGECIIVQVPNP